MNKKETQEAKQDQKQEEKKMNKKEEFLMITAKVVRAFFGSTRYDKEECNRITIKSDNMPYDDIWAYDDCGNKYTPSWLKDGDGYMNLKSNYDIPVKDAKGRRISFADWLEGETTTGAIVTVKIRQKEGAIYPVAIKVIEDGENIDPFEDM